MKDKETNFIKTKYKIGQKVWIKAITKGFERVKIIGFEFQPRGNGFYWRYDYRPLKIDETKQHLVSGVSPEYCIFKTLKDIKQHYDKRED